jgi:hypothetical protein
MSKDKTYCLNRGCGYLRCDKNPYHIKNLRIPHSFAEIEGTNCCYRAGLEKRIVNGVLCTILPVS